MRQSEFHIPQAYTEDMIQPDGMADDLSWIAVTIIWIGRCFYSAILAAIRPAQQFRLTDNAGNGILVFRGSSAFSRRHASGRG